MQRISILERIERHKMFYTMSNSKGPLLGFFMDTYYPLKRYCTAGHLPAGLYKAEDLNVEMFIDQYERLYSLYEDYCGEFIWSGAAFWGVPWMEAMAGCRVFSDYETGSSRSLPPVCFRTAEDIQEFSGDNPWVQKAQEFLTFLNRQSNGRFPLAPTLMRGFSDILAALFGSPQFIYRMMDAPQEVHRVLEKLTTIWIGFAEAQLKVIPQFHGGVGSFYYNLWMPGKGVWLQEDSAAMLSPALFERFIYPYLCRLIDHFDSTIIHLHPADFMPLDQLINTNLSAIELHIDVGGPRAEDLYPHYKKILSRKPLIIWGDMTREDIDFIHRKLNREALALLPVVHSKEQAEAIWTKFKT